MPAVRPATMADAEAVGRIYVEASTVALGPSANREAVEAAAAGAHALWRPLHRPGPDQWMLVYDLDGRFGFASFGTTGQQAGHLYALYVAPAAWSTGIGGQLHDAAIETLRRSGVRNIDLWVQDENARAHRFYLARGWINAGEERANERGTFTRMEMRL